MSFTLSILAMLLSVSSVYAADTKSVTCFNSEGSIEVQLKFVADAATEIAWRQSRSIPPLSYGVVSTKSGKQLWKGIPNEKSVAWPIGQYVGRLNAETLVLTVARNASVGGGGYSYEGILTSVDKNAAVLTWGMYCNQD